MKSIAQPSAQLAEAFNASCSISDPTPDWFVDSGASAHMTAQADTLDSVEPYTGTGHVLVGNGNTLPISHIGNCSLSSGVNLHDVLVVPTLTKNLLSISKLTADLPVDVVFSDKLFEIQNRVTKQTLAKGRCERGLYVLDRVDSALVATVRSSSLKASFTLWYLRLGHVPFSVISALNKLGLLSVTSVLPNPKLCESCELAKSKRLPFILNEKRASSVLELIHCDLWGPSPVTSSEGYRFYAVFIDDYSRFSWIYPLRAKSEFYAIFVKFHAFVCNQFSSKIKIFQSDGGSEFVNSRLHSFFDLNGIQHRLSCPYTPQQNGRAERKHRHISETGLSMSFHAHVPAVYWFDAFATAVFVINRLPTPLLSDKSPFEVLFGVVPNYANFKPFGCRVYPFLRDYAAHKLDLRSRPCIFLGYSSSHKGFRCLDLGSSQIFISRHARFDELFFPLSSSPG